ncbi:hypothetical protein scyTo_0009376 [Scyliorhinus torazame]|uniref:T-complex protein 11-like protein 1 n=1 Tax=Scyliorhinus torazame TaxID=75743 RepID=A0A401NL98_SCYTO|nr:hypothetical protein [Scyliorhinus torazame]
MPLEPGKPCGSGEEDTESTSHNRQDDSETEDLRNQLRQNPEISHSENTLTSVSPNLVSVEELIEAEKGICNMALAHEIVVDESFIIKQRDLPESSFEKTLEVIMKKAFWDSLRAQLNEDPPVYDHAIKLLGEIKESLLSFLLPGHTRLRNQINEVLDLELIKQEAENGALHIPKLADFIIGMMGTLCAPIRDDDIKNIRDITDVVELFREIFAVLDLMKLDMVNFAISSIRPHLMKQSVDYERKSFQEFFDKQHVYLVLPGIPPIQLFTWSALVMNSFNLAEAMVSMSEQICVEVNNCLSQHGFSLLIPEKETVLKGQIQAISRSDNSVRKLIDVRIQTFLKMHLVSCNPKSVAVPGGLGPVRSELEEITIKFLHLVNYNKLVFSPYYDTILTKELKKNGSQLPGPSEEEQLSSR